jgi:transposase
MDARQEKGLVIATTVHMHRVGPTFIVPSQSSTKTRYTVDVQRKRCSCPDFELRQLPCKHLFAAEYVMQRETVTTPDGETRVTETHALRVTYGQDWASYNKAQTTEKEHFCHLLRDLCASIPEPEQKRGRPRLPLSDGIFAAAFKVYSTLSGRRFMTDLRAARDQGFIRHAPCYNSIFNVIESETVTPILHDLIAASSAPLREVETQFAADATGFGTSQYFRYYAVRYGRPEEREGHDWMKLHAMVGTKTNIVTAAIVTGRNSNDSPHLPALVQATARNFTMQEVSADKGYSSRANQEAIVAVGAEPYIAFKSNAGPYVKAPLWTRLYHFFALHRDEFLMHYHRRSNVEATFSMMKRIFGDSLRSKTPTARVNEVLLKVLCHNVRVLVHEIHELGISPLFAGRPACH